MIPVGTFRAIYALHIKNESTVQDADQTQTASILAELSNNESIELAQDDEHFLYTFARLVFTFLTFGLFSRDFRLVDALSDFHSYADKIDDIRELIKTTINTGKNVAEMEWNDGVRMKISHTDTQTHDDDAVYSHWLDEIISDDDSESVSSDETGVSIVFNGKHKIDMPGMQLADLLEIVNSDILHKAYGSDQLFAYEPELVSKVRQNLY